MTASRSAHAGLHASPEKERVAVREAPPLSYCVEAAWIDSTRQLQRHMSRVRQILCAPATSEGQRVVEVLGGVEKLAATLVALWSAAGAERSAWAFCLPRIYRWSIGIVTRLEEGLAAAMGDPRRMAGVLRELEEYSSLFARAVIEPALDSASREVWDAAEARTFDAMRAAVDRLNVIVAAAST